MRYFKILHELFSSESHVTEVTYCKCVYERHGRDFCSSANADKRCMHLAS